MGIEPTPSAWKAEVLPLNYTRNGRDLTAYLNPSPLTRPIITDPLSGPYSLAGKPGHYGINGTIRVAVVTNWWRGEDSNLRRLSQQIYSLPPLTTREPLRNIKPRILAATR